MNNYDIIFALDIINFQEPDNKNVYLDYILVVPADLYNERILIEDKFDRTGEFISTCGSNNFNIDTSVEGKEKGIFLGLL